MAAALAAGTAVASTLPATAPGRGDGAQPPEWHERGRAAVADPGERILRRSVEAHGGLQAYRAVRAWEIVAERNLSGDAEVRHEIYREYFLRAGGRAHTLLVKERPEAQLVFGHDGESGFVVVGGELRTDASAAAEAYYRAHGEYYLRSLPFKWLDDGMEARYLGRERSASGWLELVQITAAPGVGRAAGDVWVAAIDADTDLLMEARLDHDRAGQTWLEPRPEGRTRITYAFSDHRTVGELRVPFRMDYISEGGRTGENLIRRFDVDVELAVEWFRPQAHVATGDARRPAVTGMPTTAKDRASG